MILTVITFVIFLLGTGIYSWYKTKKEVNLSTSKGYFLADRGLTGIVIAAAMILTNISAEQLIGLSGQAYANNISGLAWESTAAIACMMLAGFFLPVYLRRGFTTMPQFLEERFDVGTRRLVSTMITVGYVLITIPGALYSGAIAFNLIFDIQGVFGISFAASIWSIVWVIGIIGSIFTIWGGLKIIAVSDTIIGVGLIVGGFAVPLFGLFYVGEGNILVGLSTLVSAAPEKFNAVGGAKDSVPFGTIFTGMLFANMFYWCANQVLIQRTLGAKSLAEGQKGVLLSGFAKLCIPIIACFPGIIAYHIFGGTLERSDLAYPALLTAVMPTYLLGFFCALIFGVVISTYNALLNSATTLFTFDIYKSTINKKATDAQLVRFAKMLAIALAIFSMLVAPLIMYASGGLFDVLRRATGFFNIPTICILLVGLFSTKVPPIAAKITVIVHVILYTLAIFVFKVSLSYLHVMGILFVIDMAIMLLIGKVFPLAKAYVPKYVHAEIDMKPWNKTPMVMGILMGFLVLTFLVASPLGFASKVKEEGALVGEYFYISLISIVIGYFVAYYVGKYVVNRLEKQNVSQ